MGELLNYAVEQFIKSQNGLKDDIKAFNTNFPNKDMVKASIDRACKDMMARTLSVKEGQEDVNINELIKKEPCEAIIKYFKEFRSGKYDTEEKFDNWHNDICTTVLNILEEKYDSVKYGKAQKIVNMTFKYLYCFANDSERKKYFKFCHMPIDSTILEWIKKSEGKKIIVSKIPSWSNLEYEKDSHEKNKKYTYNKFLDDIRKLVANIKGEIGIEELTPLEAEFIIWPRMQLYLSAESFISQLVDNGYNVPSFEEDLDPLDKDLKRIQFVLKDV